MKFKTLIPISAALLLIFIRTFYPQTAFELKSNLFQAADSAMDYAHEVFSEKNDPQTQSINIHDTKADLMPKALSDAGKEFSLKDMTNKNLLTFRPQEKSQVSTLSASSAMSVSAPSSKDSDNSQKLDDFLKSQAVFSEVSIPANVILDIPTLPFEYKSPSDTLPCSGFGFRVHPIYGDVRFHYGTDIPMNEGDLINVFADGTVSFVGEKGGYGLCVIIDHPKGYSTLYAHCSESKVTEGQQVSMGDTIALTGHSGKATGPHLHFEIRKGDLFLNPEFYL